MIFKDKKNAEEAFVYFINNSTFKFYSEGNNGITIIAKLNKNVKSSYKYLNFYNFNQDVNQLLIKIVLIKNNKNSKHEKSDVQNDAQNDAQNDVPKNDVPNDNDNDDENIFKLDNKTSLDFTTPEEFINEVNTQIDIYLKSMKYLQPICPPICYAKIYHYNEGNKLFMHKILCNYLKLLRIYINYGIHFDSIGLIAMEYADNFKELYGLMKDKNYDNYKNMSRYLLLKLAIDTGYNHTDFHKYNILINKNDDTYFDNLNGYPLLIDFSWAQKIPVNILNTIKEKYNNKEYVEALDILYKIKRRDDINLEEHNVFDWLSKNVKINNISDKINKEIDNLINLRNNAIENIKNTSLLIPLNNNVKKYMFSGII